MTDAFWKGRKVLVTGADGFIGSHLVDRLCRLGADVRAFCLYNSNGSWGWLDDADAEVKASLDVCLGDIRDARFVEGSCRGVDTVFHLAALIAIPYSYQAYESFIDTNVKGTLNVLEGVRRARCRRMVQTSTSEVYGTPDSLPIRETHPLCGQSPYAASKIGADALCEAWYRSFDTPVVTLRPFNTFGPRQSTRAVLPTILAQLISGNDEIKLGSTSPRRDLTFVTDTAAGFVLAGSVEGVEGEVVQLGTGMAVSIGELFDLACKVVGRPARVVVDPARIRPAKSEVEVLLSDPGKAASILGWKARCTLHDGVAQTAAWVENNLRLFVADRYHV